MASPFDLYKGRTFEGVDPDRLNREAYMEQQRQLFADTFKDQLGQLGQTYQSGQEAARLNQDNLNKASAQLAEIARRTKSLEDSFKNSENNFKSTKSKLNSARASLNSFEKNLNTASRAAKVHQNSVNNQQSAMNEIENQIRERIIKLNSSFKRQDFNNFVNTKVEELLSKNKNYQVALKARNEAQVKLNKEKNRAQSYADQIKNEKNEVVKQEQIFNQAKNALNQSNQLLTQHKEQLQQASQQVNEFNKAIGGANKEAEKAMQDAQAIQQKIQSFQARSEPLKQLESQIQGGYEDVSKTSIEELKRIASNNLDPVSQRNAQNLLNQRAEQLAAAFGRNVEDVKKEMGTAVGQLQGQQFTQEDFNKFMGIEAPKPAPELQKQSDLRQDVAPQPPAQQPPQQAQIQPVGEFKPIESPAPQATATPPAPPQPQPAPQAQAQAGQTQQIKQQAQAQTTGAPQTPAPQPAPQQSQLPAQQRAQAQQSGMPKLPTPQPVQQQSLGGPLNNQIKQGFQRQLQQGFQNAMKIKATPQPAKNDAAERRQAVAAQAMGIANTSTSVSKPVDQGQTLGKNQNINFEQSQSALNKNVGRRQPR